jgi:UDP-glucose 4-epimerase
MMAQKILVTGGAGYIGSHMARLLLEKGQSVVIFDDLSTGKRSWLPEGAIFEQGSLSDLKRLAEIFDKHDFEAVFDFAAFIDVGESMSAPVKYYANNVSTLINLLGAMERRGVRKIAFSSTAAVYGDPEVMPVTEDAPADPKSPYGLSKLMGEKILADAARAGKIDHIAFRYFNVAGFHPAWPLSAERRLAHHLIANIMAAANGAAALEVFGNDYPTPDGTCIRDFIAIGDLCEAHWLALEALRRGVRSEAINLGSETGFSVLEVIRKTSEIVGRTVPYGIAPRREGDIIRIIASPAKAKRILGWAPKTDLETMLRTVWRARRV